MPRVCPKAVLVDSTMSSYLFRSNARVDLRFTSILQGVGLILTFAGTACNAPVRGTPLHAVRFGQATGPLRVSNANPRYFSDGSGRIVYLTGSHTWANLQDSGVTDPPPKFDYVAYLNFLQEHNHNFTRLWTSERARWAQWTKTDFWFEPLPYRRSGPGLALDGKPKFDLSRFDEAYFTRLRERVVQAGERGIYVSVMLFEGWSIEDKHEGKNPWPAHPYNRDNNINGVDGDSDDDGQGKEVHTLQIPAITALQEAYVRKVIDTVNDLDNVLFEISDESDNDSKNWQYHMIRYVRSYEARKPKQHPVGMTACWPKGRNSDLFASPADWISPNSDGGYKTDPPAATGDKVVISDTDHLWGVGGSEVWVWKSFTRGLNPILMDPYDGAWQLPPGFNSKERRWVWLRRNMGYTLTYANRIGLVSMTPHGELASTRYCLANPVAKGGQYLVYLPSGGTVEVDLSATREILSLEWFFPTSGTTMAGGQTVGGNKESFTAPITSGDAVLYIYQSKAAEGRVSQPPETPKKAT